MPTGLARLTPFPDSLGSSPLNRPCERPHRRSRERESCEASIFRSAGFQNALIEMKFFRGGAAKFKGGGLLDGVAEGFEAARRGEPSERKVCSEHTLFARDGKRLERGLNRRGYLRKFRAGFDSGPKHARAAHVREKSKAPKFYEDGSAGRNGSERGLYRFQLFRRCFADEFQRDVKALRTPSGMSIATKRRISQISYF
jgi:hypothetical protein